MKRTLFFVELKRRNVLRAGAFYLAAVWALAQGIAQLSPVVGAPDWVARWFLVAAAVGFPFWITFAWFYELTPAGLKRESQIDPSDSIMAHTGKKLDRWIIAIMAVAIVLLLTDRFVLHQDGDADISTRSIAVLPLVNASGDEGQQYFSDGLSEDLITALSQFGGLKVISRNSSFQFRASKDESRTIGRKLGVARLLEGSVRRVGDVVRISAELINAADGSTLWSKHYDRPYKDLFALQDEITNAVAGELEAQLLSVQGAVVQSDRPPSGNLDAYNHYLQGVFYTRRNNLEDGRKAIAQFAAAFELDPRYAFAEAQLSSNAALLASAFSEGDAAQQAYAQARTAANNALALDPKLAAAHVARGNVLAFADMNWVGAEAEFRLAVQLAPNDGQAAFSLGTMVATLGHPEEALALTRGALANDPRNTGWSYWLSVYLQSLGQLDEAEQVIRSVIAMQPEATATHQQLATIEIQRGHAAAALQAAQQEPPGMWRNIALAMAAQIGPDRAAADAALKKVVGENPDSAAYQIADAYALRHDPDGTFAWLDRAWANHDTGVHRLLYDPFVAPYRSDARFAAFCRKVGLPTPAEVGATAGGLEGSGTVKNASGPDGKAL
jgi:TolB-like protein/Tfp pilus assembly protein PilF